MPPIRAPSTRRANNRPDMFVSKDPKAAYNIHFGRSRWTTFRARVYTFLDHPRYQKNYWFYLPAMLYHIVVYSTLCATGLVLEMYDDTWMREFAYYKWGLANFDVRRYAQVVGKFASALLVAEFVLRVWSCVSDNKYGGNHKEMDPAVIRANYRRGRLLYIQEGMNIFELLVTLILAFNYFVWCPHPHLRFFAFTRAIHWDKSVHAARLFKLILSRGYRFIFPIWAIGFMILAMHTGSIYQCERYYRLDNATIGETDIDNLGDALWYTYVTSMSIGFGDYTPKTGLCRFISIVSGYVTSVLMLSVQTAVSLFLVKHIAEESYARNDIKVQNLAAKVIQTWARFHMARRKFPSSDKWTEICCQKLYRAKQKIEQQKRLAGMIQPARRLIKRAKRSSLTRQRSGLHINNDASTAPPAASLHRKRGSLPNHLHGLFSMTVATAAVFANNRVDSTENEPLAEENDYYSVQNTVDERFLRMHNKDRSGVSSLSRAKTNREEFGPLVLMIQFLLFGLYKRRFRNSAFRKPQEKKVQDDQEKLAAVVKDVERQFEQLVLRCEAQDKEAKDTERVVERIEGTVAHIAEKMKMIEDMRHSERSHEVRKRKATLIEIGKQDSGEQVPKRKNTIM